MTICPRCGCNRCHLEETNARGGRPWARYRCDNDECDATFYDGERPRRVQPTIVEQKVLCPNPLCRHDRVPVTSKVKSTALPGWEKRYRKCARCQETFHTLVPPTAEATAGEV